MKSFDLKRGSFRGVKMSMYDTWFSNKGSLFQTDVQKVVKIKLIDSHYRQAKYQYGYFE